MKKLSHLQVSFGSHRLSCDWRSPWRPRSISIRSPCHCWNVCPCSRLSSSRSPGHMHMSLRVTKGMFSHGDLSTGLRQRSIIGFPCVKRRLNLFLANVDLSRSWRTERLKVCHSSTTCKHKQFDDILTSYHLRSRFSSGYALFDLKSIMSCSANSRELSKFSPAITL